MPCRCESILGTMTTSFHPHSGDSGGGQAWRGPPRPRQASQWSTSPTAIMTLDSLDMDTLFGAKGSGHTYHGYRVCVASFHLYLLHRLCLGPLRSQCQAIQADGRRSNRRIRSRAASGMTQQRQASRSTLCDELERGVRHSSKKVLIYVLLDCSSPASIAFCSDSRSLVCFALLSQCVRTTPRNSRYPLGPTRQARLDPSVSARKMSPSPCVRTRGPRPWSSRLHDFIYAHHGHPNAHSWH